MQEHPKNVADISAADTQVEVDIVTPEQHRENVRQAYLLEQESHIRRNLSAELLDHMILQFTGKEFADTTEFMRLYKTEALAFLHRYDCITPSVQKNTIKQTIDDYLKFRCEIIGNAIHKTRTAKQTWWDWMTFKKPNTEQIVSTPTKIQTERTIKLGKYREALDMIRKIKEHNDDQEIPMDYATLYEHDDASLFEENIMSLAEQHKITKNFLLQ